MLNKVLKTPVDDLVEFVKTNPSCKVSLISTSLKIPTELIEKWLVILEEYKVLKIKYRGFEGFVHLNSNQIEKTNNVNETVDIDKIKNDFLKKVRSKNLSNDKITEIWRIFLKKYESEIKTMFFEKAKLKGYNNTKTNLAWGKFSIELEKL